MYYQMCIDKKELFFHVKEMVKLLWVISLDVDNVDIKICSSFQFKNKMSMLSNNCFS